MNKDKLTHQCHQIAHEKKVPFNVVMTYYFLETILKKITESRYHNKFIFKGGFLLSNIIGIESRTTSDMDFVINHLKMDELILKNAINEVLDDEEISYQLINVSRIKEKDIYGGFRISVLCQLENIRQTIHLDVATGDPITPTFIPYNYKSLFSKTQYSIFAYNVETILAEKLETIYRLSFYNTRCKDYYDIYVLYNLDGERIDYLKLRKACTNTFLYRKTVFDIKLYIELLMMLKEDVRLLKYWDNYKNKFTYASNISFQQVIESCFKIMKKLNES